MGIFDGILLCCDCDGTMTDNHGILQPEDAEAIRHFQEEGGLFTFATGRFPKYIGKFVDMFRPNTYQVMSNGTVLYDVDHQRVLYSVTMEPPRELIDFVVSSGLCHTMYVDHEDHSVCWSDDPEVMKHYSNRITVKSVEELYDDPEPWHKINFCFATPEETLAAEALLKQRYPDENFVCSWATGVEMLPRGAGKGPCVLRLKALLGEKVHTVVCAGDYGNDVSMILAADIGYAVANASEEAKAAADRITCSNEDHAVRQIIRDLEASLA